MTGPCPDTDQIVYGQEFVTVNVLASTTPLSTETRARARAINVEPGRAILFFVTEHWKKIAGRTSVLYTR